MVTVPSVSLGSARVLVLVGLLAACSSSAVSSRGTVGSTTTASTTTTSTTTTATEPVTVAEPTVVMSPEGVGASLERYREDDVPNRIQIQVTSSVKGLVELTELRLVSPAFGELPAAATRHTLGEGQRADLPVQLGRAQCSSPPKLNESAPSGLSFAVGKMAVNGSVATDVRIPITDVRNVIDRLYGPACTVQAVGYAASIEFGPTWVDTEYEGKPAATGTLRIARKNSSEPITITEIRGSVLLRFRPEKPPNEMLIALGAREQLAEVPVLLVQSGDCRPHAIADSKHTFFLPAVVTIGSNPTVVIDVMPDAKSQIQLSAMINRSCGL
jgi:hypothetical protein